MRIDEPPPVSPVPVEDVTGGRVVARFLAKAARHRRQAAVDTGRLRPLDHVELLAPERLPELARQSLWLLLGSGAGFLALELLARRVQHADPILGALPLPMPARIAVLLAANVVSYALVLPLHEAAHAGAILALGGRPRFGLKLPLAAYCTAPGQLFTIRGYTFVALAPLVTLTLAGAVATWLWPDVGACILFALAGNVSGAVGDLTTVARIHTLPPDALIADTATGFSAYAVAE
jgi:putative zincin peptidase